MNGSGTRRRVAIIAAGGALAVLLPAVWAQQSPRGGSGAPRAPAKGTGPAHGTPKGWKFKWPKGDVAKGREVFAKLECHSCHEVRGESFPGPTDRDRVGPELAQMGPLHEPEYFAESIINPNAVIEKGRGYQGPDGSSKMPSYNDSVTVQEVVDLVAFLRGLKPSGDDGGHKH